ncbi:MULTISPECIES: hypothetical protein [Peribacillus]|jgi:hypothetical protein|uniref:hypothetical protein n=1 Tax=Peribacillus TaxID=2675229 RepID=UPI000AE5B232|nr:MULTISPECIES: hypothetical protein [Peribacillus]MBX9955094.1 hypothetical protein [Peribacillus simplex]MCY8935750.1 hypothetical protein [Peribacillus frigoritolerans]MDG4849263.1 hypothetical protein [Peribacillus frigoritolerans]MED4693010.1 hypothetical protein [Peribacillus frigoritolerans]
MFLVDGGVPPPIQIAVICLSAVKVAVPLPISVPKNLVTDQKCLRSRSIQASDGTDAR